MNNKTLTIIKPKALSDNCAGKILSTINANGFRIQAMRMMRLTKPQAEAFYAVHKDRPFFHDLVEFMTSGPIIAAILEKENAVEEYRQLIGSTNPEDAADETIRAMCGTNIQMNAVHGSDSDENAEKEANFFFSYAERF
jgi:nucleoside-diphosphate kinase